MDDERWIDARWPPADGGGPGRPWITEVFETRSSAREAFLEHFSLAYDDGDPEPYVSRQVMALTAALKDETLAEAYLAYLGECNEMLRRRELFQEPSIYPGSD